MTQIPASSVPSNAQQVRAHDLASKEQKPHSSGLQFLYGTIHEVQQDLRQVRVRLLEEDGDPGEFVGGGKDQHKYFLPIINQETDINLRWGELREGLVVKVWWRGGDIITGGPVVEVIGDERGTKFLERKPVEEIEPGVYKILSGGMG